MKIEGSNILNRSWSVETVFMPDFERRCPEIEEEAIVNISGS
jgi:hypothetical protein